jgi:hypothetical protein
LTIWTTIWHKTSFSVFKGILPPICPAASTRIPKRSKARMIAWLDRNAGELFHFLVVNRFFSEAWLSSVRWRLRKVEKEADCCWVWVRKSEWGWEKWMRRLLLSFCQETEWKRSAIFDCVRSGHFSQFVHAGQFKSEKTYSKPKVEHNLSFFSSKMLRMQSSRERFWKKNKFLPRLS